MSTASTSSFTRYAAAVGATLAAASLAHAVPGTTVFDTPYKTGGLPFSLNDMGSGTVTSGAWTWSTTGNHNASRIRAESPTSFTVSVLHPFGPNSVDFTTTIVSGFESLSFNYNASGYGNYSVSLLTNGVASALTGTGAISDLTLAAGDVFGFRVTAQYQTGSDYGLLTVSNFSGSAAVAAVPEPAETAAWMAVGVAGLVAMRELRRRREAAA